MASGNLHNGITFGNVTEGCITNGSAWDNPDNGIRFDPGSSTILVKSNVIAENGNGLHLDDASGGNILFDNRFNNTQNVFIEDGNPGNQWNITKTAGDNIAGGDWLGGNYWATPAGDGWSEVTPDSDGDGFCDAVYGMSGADVDYLPLAPATTQNTLCGLPPSHHGPD